MQKETQGYLFKSIPLAMVILLIIFSSPGPEQSWASEEAPKCAICHDRSGVENENNQAGLYIDFNTYNTSVHGDFNCTTCHQSHSANPHERDLDNIDESVKAIAKELEHIRGRDPYAIAICTSCHYDTFEEFRTSVHGVELFENKNPDVPYCLDCHGSPHYIRPNSDPAAATYYANIPHMCGSCHEDTEIISKYKLNKNVIEGYNESFHGKKLILGSSKVAVCISCHGSHSIFSPSDSTRFLNKLSTVCGQCHEGATVKFAQAFTHIPISERQSKLVYLVERIFGLLLIVVIISLVGHGLLDIIANIKEHRRAAK